MAESLRKRLDRRLNALRTERQSFVPHWQELNNYILPRSGRFFTTDRNKGDKRNQLIQDSTASYAVEVLSSGMMGGLTSPSRPWFALRTPDPDLNKIKSVRVWLDIVKQRMFEVIQASNLYTVLPGTYRNLATFGTDAFSVMEDRDEHGVFQGIRCYSFPVGSYYLGSSYRGTVDTCYREFSMTAGQIVEQFGEENCSQAMLAAYHTNRDAWFDVIHAVEPNENFEDGAIESKRFRFRSVYYEKGNNEDKVLEEKGFHDFPIMASRWDLTGEDVYGSSPGMAALPFIKQLQLEQKKKVQAIEKMVNPPVQAPTSLKNGGGIISTLPGGINYVDVSSGQQGLTPVYQIDPQLAELKADIDDIRLQIRQAFFVDLFLMMANDDRSNITATEIAARKEEKLQMLGPVLERLNDELFDPLIDRIFGIMLRNGMIPPPPEELSGMELSIEYISMIAEAMKLVGMSGIQRLAGFVGSLGAVYPEAYDAFDPDVAIEEMAASLSTPPRLVRDMEERKAMRAMRAQQAQQDRMMAQAQQGAQTAQTLAQTRVDEPSALSQIMQQYGGMG